MTETPGKTSTPEDLAERLKDPTVIYVPTPDSICLVMLMMAAVGADDVVYDLGSGDGRIPILAAEKFGARAVGFELDVKLVEAARAKAEEAGVSHLASFSNEDIFEADFSDATVITLYLFPVIQERLKPKLLALKPGTRIVSHAFPIGDWKPVGTLWEEDRLLNIWIVPDLGQASP
jgi:SAM-dependent methyltransferase